MKALVFLSISILLFSCTSELLTPIEKSNFTSLTSHHDILEFAAQASDKSSIIDLDTLTYSIEKRAIPLLRISEDGYKNSKKVNVMIFAQQHGNEHGGKEASLLLLKNIVNGKLDYIFSRINLILIPQVNPDGSEKNKRRNGNGTDLNRDHLLLSQNETKALHKLYYDFMPEVVLDVHEYSPYSKSWIDFGYLKNYDVQMGTVTNPNIDVNLQIFSKEKILPFIKNEMNKNKFTFHEYLLGGPPNNARMRYSTVDINDGRQSFGILNTLSFIQEGKNGKDSLENIKRRTESQYLSMKLFLEAVFDNADEIRKIVAESRADLLNGDNSEVAIRMEHVKGSETLAISLKSLISNQDTTIEVDSFHSTVKPLLTIEKPKGYLIPSSNKQLVELLSDHNIRMESYTEGTGSVYQYKIILLSKSVDEELENYFPELEKVEVSDLMAEEYLYVPTNQLGGNMLVTALEPQSMLGLIQYDEYFWLINNKDYPILKIE